MCDPPMAARPQAVDLSASAAAAAALESASSAERSALAVRNWASHGLSAKSALGKSDERQAVDIDEIQAETEAAAEVLACRASVERLRAQRRQVETIKANAERKDRLILLLREQLGKARDEIVKFQSAWENQAQLQARSRAPRARARERERETERKREAALPRPACDELEENA